MVITIKAVAALFINGEKDGLISKGFTEKLSEELNGLIRGLRYATNEELSVGKTKILNNKAEIAQELLNNLGN